MKAAIKVCMLVLLSGGCADDDARPRGEQEVRALDAAVPRDAGTQGVAADSGNERDAGADSGYVIRTAADRRGVQDAAADGGDRSLMELDACEDADCRVEPVCDGSDAIRLAYTGGGGGVAANDYGFRFPYGFTFLVIDGSCHYYASVGGDAGTVECTLSDADAARLSQDMQLAKLPRWNGSYGGCPDAPTANILTASERIGVSCHRDAAPAAAAEVIGRAERWLADLFSRGAELTGPVRALAKREDGVSASTPTYDWPVAQPLAEVPGLVFVPSYTEPSPAGARFDGADAKALRALRAKAYAASEEAAASGRYVPSPVVKAGADAYLLYLRDELPPAQDKAFRAFLKRRR